MDAIIVIAAQFRSASSPYPTLQALDVARGPDRLAFASDRNAAHLEQRARQLTDQHWSEYVWITGRVIQFRFDLVCDALEGDRLAQQRIDVVVVSDQPSRIAS
jgi:hypothetical protein